jgi:hypothetical protein
MDRFTQCPNGGSHRKLINFVPVRPGHDFRYAIDFAKLNAEIGWSPKHSFEAGLNATGTLKPAPGGNRFCPRTMPASAAASPGRAHRLGGDQGDPRYGGARGAGNSA